MMKEKMRFSQLMSLSLMLFALFFGAGNMIFPPAMGQEAGTNLWWALGGFIVTDVGISLLAIAAIVLAGKSLKDLCDKVGKGFAVLFAVLVYCLIGPLFAIPRTGSTSFELAVLPFLGENTSTQPYLAVFTLIFFALTFLLSVNPQKIVDIVGKILTPILLLAIAIIGVGIFINPIGEIAQPIGEYQQIPFFKGLIEGYLALDGLAALVFALIVIENVQACGVNKKSNIIKYSLLAGILASLGLAAVYGVLTYVGAVSVNLGTFANGGQILAAVTNQLYGKIGSLILGVAVVFACLTTAIGLTTSFGDYFHELYPKVSYRMIIFAVSLFSFLIANVGLTALISVTLPILIMVYPVTVVLIVASFLEKFFDHLPEVYIGAMILALCVSIIDGLETGGLYLGWFSDTAALLPFYQQGIGWVIPALIGAVLGYVIGKWRRKAS